MSAIKKILVPVDFSSCSAQAVDYALFVAKTFDAHVDLMHAWQPPYEFGPLLGTVTLRDPETETETSYTEFIEKQASTALTTLVAQLAQKGATVGHRLEPGPAKRAIIEAAAAGAYDLIIIGTHGRTGLAHTFLGSVAEWVVRHATIPVLTVRGADQPK